MGEVHSVLADVSMFCTSAQTGSVIIISVNAHPDNRPDNVSPEGMAEYRLERLTENVGKDRVPADIKGKDLAGWGKAAVFWRIITNQINETLNTRNGPRMAGSKIRFEQLFHFRYQDGAKMLTIGGVIYEEGQSNLLASCGFKDLHFSRSSNQPYLLEIPNLTFREIRYLDAQLPLDNSGLLQAVGIPDEDLKKYGEIYRYFPTFTEAEM